MHDDAVRHLKTGVLAQVLDLTNDVAKVTASAEIVVQFQVQRHDFTAVARHRESTLTLHAKLDVVAGQFEDAGRKCERHRAARFECLCSSDRVERRERRLQFLHRLAESRSDGSKVGHQIEGEYLGEFRAVLEYVDVELVLHHARGGNR